MTTATDLPPHPGGLLEPDAAALAGYAAAQERALAALPARPRRDAVQQRRADAALGAARAARRQFLARHAAAVYDQLTDGRSRRVRLPDLLRAAAEQFSGLVPSAAQLAGEAGLIQADRDGREIDQGIFCGAVLRSAPAGRHLIDTMLMPSPRGLELLPAFRETGRADLSAVSVERRDGAAHVTFRNPRSLNAEDNALIADLETAIDLALLDDGVRVGVLRGGPVDHPRHDRVFSAGINLKDLRNGAISFAGFLLGRELGYVHKMLRGLVVAPDEPAWADRAMTKPWVGAVDAFAIGGGMQLLLVLDKVVAEDSAYVSLPAADEGIVPGLGGLRLTRQTGARLARQVILGGRRIEVSSPAGQLICDEAVPASQLTEAVDRAVDTLSGPGLAANRMMLALAEEPVDLYRQYLAEFAVAQAARSYSADVLARVERRWQRSQARG